MLCCQSSTLANSWWWTNDSMTTDTSCLDSAYTQHFYQTTSTQKLPSDHLPFLTLQLMLEPTFNTRLFERYLVSHLHFLERGCDALGIICRDYGLFFCFLALQYGKDLENKTTFQWWPASVVKGTGVRSACPLCSSSHNFLRAPQQ